MATRGTRTLIVLSVASAVAAGGVLLGAAAMALAASGTASPATVAGAGLLVAVFVTWGASSMLARRVARPVERILEAARALQDQAPGELPLVGDSGHGLDQAALAFERTAAALAAERARLAAKVAELTTANQALAEARASLIRSEKLATVGRLAAGIAHEVGNPLGAVAGYAELARGRLPPGADPQVREALERIAAAADRIDRIVRDLLDFARPSPLEVRPLAVEGAVEAAVRLASVQGRFREVQVVRDLPADLPPVLGDERHLSQVVLNLLLNAGDATQGRGRVEVRARRQGDHVHLSVSDDGPGIAPDDLPRVFDPFFSTKEPGQGSGLGLAICHSIVESMGGSIDAASPPGGGATFVVRLRAAC
jgi:two-component system, NtrC family, sensor kinase